MKDMGAAITDWTSMMEKEGRDVLAKAEAKWELGDQLKEMGLYPYFQPIEENQGPVAIFRGKQVIMLGSNNYLGLTTHPKVREAAKRAIDQHGTSMTGSRFVNGTLPMHEELEAKLAAFFGKDDGLVFTTGYQANLGVLTALINKSSVTVVDKFSHASVHDGCKLANGENLTFRHNDTEDLERVLSKVSPNKGILILVDGVYSSEGDLAPLPEIVRIAKKYQARIAVDEAHGVGVMGPGGRGAVHHFGLQDQIDLIIGTFSKSLASVGGFVVGSKNVIDFIRHLGRPMIFSASLPPSSVAAAMAALEILIAEPERAEKVRANATFMKQELARIGYHVGNSSSAVIPLVIGDELKTFCIWKDLLDAGVYTNPFLYPAVAKGQGTLRTSYLATHEQSHLDQALAAFKTIAKNYDIQSAA